MSMSIARDSFWMMGSTALRLASGMFVFIVLARVMGVDNFGILMTWFAVAALCALPTNFGLSVYLLREAVRSEARCNRLLNQALGLKVLICSATVLLLILASFSHVVNASVLWPLFLMHSAESFTDLLCAQMRVSGAYAQETNFVTKQAVLQFLVVSLVAVINNSPSFIAWGFAVSRVVSLFVAKGVVTVLINDALWPQFKGSGQVARGAMHYFVDFGVQSTLIQIDIVLLGYFSGPTAVGIYQAGMRIVHGLSQLISVLVNVLLPRLSRNLIGQRLNLAIAGKVSAVFMFAGLTLGFTLYETAQPVTHSLYGYSFRALVPVLQLLALFLFIRFVGAAAGVLLIANGNQGIRALTMLLGLLVLCVAGYYLMPEGGAFGAAQAMCVTYAFIALSLVGFVMRELTVAKRHERFSALKTGGS